MIRIFWLLVEVVPKQFVRFFFASTIYVCTPTCSRSSPIPIFAVKIAKELKNIIESVVFVSFVDDFHRKMKNCYKISDLVFSSPLETCVLFFNQITMKL